MKNNSVLCGSVENLTESLDNDSIDTIITSPPYYKQREYGSDVGAEIGREKTPDEYVARLQRVFSSLRPKLKPSGTLWLNLGDKYHGKHQLGLPWRVALALMEDGWILRSDVIWHKPNAMPQSVKDRLATDHEYIFLFSKSPNYYFDWEAIKEPYVTLSDASKMRGGRGHFGKNKGTPGEGKYGGLQGLHKGDWSKTFHAGGRRKRSVWSVPISKYKGAHFAVFPEKLIRTCVIAGCPVDGTVLDPFFGVGTTGVVCIQERRNYIGFELQREYAEIAERRLQGLLI